MSAHDVKLFGDQIAASRLESRFARLKASSLIRLAIEDLYPGRIALVSSFGADAAALLHMVSRVDKATPVIFVDTGQHFPETLAYRDELCATLGLTNVISRRRPTPRRSPQEDPEKFLFASDPDRCCDIRKVRPLAEAMEGYDAWITGRKGFQSATRATLPLFEAEGERVKVNPLVGWSATDVLDYIREAGLPRHPLVAKGFPSIGCLPCTSPVKPGEDERAGRWRGRGKTECGIHIARARRGSGHLMALWRRDGFAEDAWTRLADEARGAGRGRGRRLAEALARRARDARRARAAPVGVAVEAGAEAQAHLADLADRPLVALAFAKFADGRAFSYARLLRDRYRLQRRIARDRRRADRRDPAHAALRLRLVRSDQRADAARARGGPPAGAGPPLSAGSGGDEAPDDSRPWRTVSTPRRPGS